MTRIPNIIHYTHLVLPGTTPKPFSLVHFLAVKSAYIYNRPDTIFFHCTEEPTGEWWEQARPYVTINKVEAPTSIAGRRFYHPAHSSDLLRLYQLREHGGIYLDLDVICTRSFAPLRDHEFCLGQQGVNGSLGICNAVILAEPHAFMTDRWIEGFDPATSLLQGFRSQAQFDEYWCEMSVDYPAVLAQRWPEHITVLPHDAFHWPLYMPDHLAMLFDEDHTFPNAYCHHLWQSLSWEPYLSKLSVADIMERPSTFNRIARTVLTTD